ncbi:AAA family ATPase [Streptomyces sp. NPDC086091]|uniref:helix-turn-helix transcriptional regulator n=1 Tax=Streptomyces sp. NPDC086091 TaxID=3365751 RepID=UPI00381ADB4E
MRDIQDTVPTLRGRDEELEAVEREIRRAVDGPARMVVVEGEPGMGKSAFGQALRNLSQRAGMTVGHTAADESDRDTPLATLGVALRSGGASALLSGDDLAVLLPLVEQPLWFAERLASLIRDRAQGRPFHVALDDFHWSDPLSVFILRVLPTRLADLPALWTLLSRPAAGGAAEAVAEANETQLPLSRIRLGPLSDRAVADIARDRTGRAPDHRMRERIAEAGGMPFLAVHIADGLVSPGGSGSARPDGLPGGLVDGVRRRLARTSGLCRSLLGVGSVLGSSFTLGEAARVMGATVLGLDGPLTEAVHAGLLRDDGTQVRFPHDLLRRAVYEDLSPSIRGDLHRTAAQSVLPLADGAVRAVPHVLAYAVPGDTRAVGVLRDAAYTLLDTMAVTSADIICKAYDLTGDDPGLRTGVARDVLEILVKARRYAQAGAFADTVLPTFTDPEAEAEARLLLASALWAAGRTDASRHFACDVPAADSVLRRRLAGHRALAGEDLPAEGDDHDPVMASILLVLRAEEAERSGAFADALALCTRAAALCRDGAKHAGHLAWTPLSVRCLVLRAVLAERMNTPTQHVTDPTGPESPVSAVTPAEGPAAAGEPPSGFDSWFTARHIAARAYAHLLADRPADASAAADQALALASELDDPRARPEARTILALAALLQDRTAAARAHIAELSPDAPSARVLTALLADGDGLPGAPAALLRALEDAPGLWPDELLIHAACSAHRHDDMETLRAAEGRLRRLARLNPASPDIAAAAALAHGILTGDLGPARHAAIGSVRPLLRARIEEEWGRAALRASRDEAVEALESAEAACTAAHAWTPAKRVRRVLTAAGAGSRRGRVRQDRYRPTEGWDSLTPAERRVAWLVAQGHTNRSAARELVVSPSTVSTQLKSVFGKLEVHSRVQLTRFVLSLPAPSPSATGEGAGRR